MRGKTWGVILACALCAAGVRTAQADPSFTNPSLVSQCRGVMVRAAPERTRYLRRELFNYEMSIAAGASLAEQSRHEDNLRETCEVVSRTAGIGGLNLGRRGGWNASASEQIDYPRLEASVPSRHRPPVEALSSRVPPASIPARAEQATVPAAWQRPLFEAQEDRNTSSGWTSSGVVESGLRRMLHLQ